MKIKVKVININSDKAHEISKCLIESPMDV